MGNDIQGNIQLGQAQNLAMELLKVEFMREQQIDAVTFMNDSLKEYEELVEMILTKNKKLHEKLVQGKDEVEEYVNSKNKESSKPVKQEKNLCGNCGDELPIGWKYHQKCGWKGK